MKEELNRKLYRDIKDGKSIVSSLVDIGVHSHRPYEAMTDAVLEVNKKFANLVSDQNVLTDYLVTELTKAKRTYVQKIKDFM